jgi:acyl carrier protein
MHDRLRSVLQNVFDLSDAEVGKDLARDEVPRWDSLTHMDLVTSLEKEFSVRLTIDDIIQMTSLAAIRAVMEAKTNCRERG